MLRRWLSDPLSFDVVPPTRVAAVLLLDDSTGYPAWGFGYHLLESSIENLAAEFTSIGRSDRGGGKHSQYFELDGPAEELPGKVLETISVGRVPRGYDKLAGVQDGAVKQGHRYTLVLVGARVGFLRFAL